MKNIFFSVVVLFSTIFTYAQNWESLTSGTIQDLYSVCFIGTNIGYVVGDSCLVTKTINGGINWEQQNIGNSYFSIRSVFFRDVNIGWLAGQDGIIKRTINGGDTWTNPLLLASYVPWIYSLYFPTLDTGYIVGGYESYYNKTTTGGDYWLDFTCLGSNSLKSVMFIDEYVGIVVGDSGTIMKTENGGIQWHELTSGTFKNLNSVQFISYNKCYIAGDSGTILKSENGGSSWTLLTSGTQNRLNSIYFIDEENGYCAGDNGTILNTNNGGITWSSLVSGTIDNLHSICFPALDTGYVVGDNGTILKTTNGGGVGVNQGFTNSNMIKIYPIPTQDLVNIEIEDIVGQVSLSIYQLNGQVLIEKPNISVRSTIDLSTLPTGVYVAKVTNEQTVYVRKIIKE